MDIQPDKRTNTDTETGSVQQKGDLREDTPEAHWERFKAATRLLATTPKPGIIPRAKPNK